MNENKTTPAPRRNRRRTTPRKVIDNSVPSPCVKVCFFSDNSTYCDGCNRTMDEIRDWYTMDKEDKLALLETLKIRKVELGL